MGGGGCRQSRGVAVNQFNKQAEQRWLVVNVVPNGKQFHFQAALCGSLQGLRKDHAGAPRDIFKEVSVTPLKTDQVIPSVFGRAKHGAITGRRNRSNCLVQDRKWEGRSIGGHQADGRISGREEVVNAMNQTLGQIRPALRDQAKLCRQKAIKRGLFPNWCVGDEAVHWGLSANGGNVSSDVLDEATVQGGCLLCVE